MVNEEAVENDEEKERLTSVSQQMPASSMISKMTGRSYISILHKKLKQEQDARVELENELNELKHISS